MGKEELHSAIREKEAKILGKDVGNKESGQVISSDEKDLVDEQKVSEAVGAIEARIQASPLSQKYKDQLVQKLTKSTDGWQKRVERFRAEKKPKYEIEFKALFEKILADFREFERRPGVKEIFEALEPLFVNEQEVKAIINLENYKRNSGDWKKINARLALIGFDSKMIRDIQKILAVQADGKIGPQTIIAINREIYNQEHEVKFSDEETAHAVENADEFNLRSDEAGRIINSEGWRKIDAETERRITEVRNKQKGAKTVADLEKFEREEKQIKEDSRRAKQAYISDFRAPVQAQAKGVVVNKPADSVPTSDPELPDARSPAQDQVVEGGAVPAQDQPSSDKLKVPESEEVTVEKIEVPEDFRSLNSRLELPEEVLAKYYKAYLDCDPGKKIPVEEISQELNNVTERFFSGLDEATARRTLIEIFGKLVNGYRENLVANEVLVLNIDWADQCLVVLAERLKVKEENRIHLEGLRQRQIEWLANTVKENPSWYEFWNPSQEGLVSQAVDHLGQYEKMLADAEGEIASINSEILNLSASSFVNQYQLLKNEGADTRELLLRMHDALGEYVPEFLNSEVEAAILVVQQDPNASEFDRLIYAGKYEEAIQVLAKENRERTKIPGFSGRFGEHDIVAAYRKFKDSGESRAIAEKFKGKDSFAAQKLAEGYVPIPVNKTEKSSGAVFMVKKHPDGSLTYVWVVSTTGDRMGSGYPDSKAAQLMGQEHVLSVDKLSEMDKQEVSMKERLARIISGSPSFKAIHNAGTELNKNFASLQTLFQETLSGNKTEEFVSFLKKRARDIKGSNAIPQLRSNITQARKELSALKSVAGIGIMDEFEQNILKLEKQLYQVTLAVEDNKIESFCDYILSSDFDDDSFGKWVIKEGLPFLATILAATAAVVVTISTFGVGGVAGLALVAGVGSFAGMAGHELATIGSHYLGKAVYGEKFSNKTLLGRYLTDEQVYNPETGEYEDIKLSELSKIYGKQFVIGFVTTFALLGLGQLAGKFLAKFASENATSAGFAGMTARLLGRIPRLSPQRIDLLKQKGLDSMLRKVGKEFLQETGEESAQTVAEKGHPALGFMVSLYSCLNGGKVEYKLGKFDLVAEGSQNVNGNEVATNWSYDSSKSAEFLRTLESEYGKQGFSVEADKDGIVTVSNEITLKDGTTLKNKMIFRPSRESLTMRQIFKEGLDSEGKSEMERLYGVKQKGENDYSFRDFAPKGKLTFVQFLQRRGFVIDGDPNEGNFKAVKGGEVVKFEGKVTGETLVDGKKYPVWAQSFQSALDTVASSLQNVQLRQRVKVFLADLRAGWSGNLTMGGERMSHIWRSAINMKDAAWSGFVKKWQRIRTDLDAMAVDFRKAIDGFMDAVNQKRDEMRGKIEALKGSRESFSQNTREARERRMNPEGREYVEVKRETDVMYIPDIHGDVQALKNSMQALGLIDAAGKWIGGNKVVQFSGDYIDRGTTNLETLDFLVDIKHQAEAAGGRVDMLMGNHEALMIGAIFGVPATRLTWLANGGSQVLLEVVEKYGLEMGISDIPSFKAQLQKINKAKGRQAFEEFAILMQDYAPQFEAALTKLHQDCFQTGGRYYDLIRSWKPASQVDDVLYVHAGVSPKWSEMIRDLGVDGVNHRWQQALDDAQRGNFTLFNEFNEIGKSRNGNAQYGGLFWIDFDAEIETMPEQDIQIVAENLKRRGINAVVVGHSKLNNPKLASAFERYGIKIVASDVGMSSGYRGKGNSGKGGVRIDTQGNIVAESNEASHRLYDAQAEIYQHLREKIMFMQKQGTAKLNDIFENEGRGAESYQAELASLLKDIDAVPGIENDADLMQMRNDLILQLRNVETLIEQRQKTDALIDELWGGRIDSDIKQGKVGNCYLIAALKALKGNPKLMREVIGKTIIKVGHGRWKVRFSGDFEVGEIEITEDSLRDWNQKHSAFKGAKGDMILEAAYASLRSRLRYGRGGHTQTVDSKGNYPVEAGFGHRALYHLLGNSVTKHKRGLWEGYSSRGVYNSYESLAEKGDAFGTEEFFAEEFLRNRNGLVVTANSVANREGDSSFKIVEGHKIYATHAYAVIGYNPKRRIVILSNPHDSARHFELSIDSFNKHFTQLSYVKINPLFKEVGDLENLSSPQFIFDRLRSLVTKYNVYDLFNARDRDELTSGWNTLIDSTKNPIVKDALMSEIAPRVEQALSSYR